MNVVEYVFRTFPCTRFGAYKIVLQEELYMYLNACRQASHIAKAPSGSTYSEDLLPDGAAHGGNEWELHTQSVFFVVAVAKLERQLKFL